MSDAARASDSKLISAPFPGQRRDQIITVSRDHWDILRNWMNLTYLTYLTLNDEMNLTLNIIKPSHNLLSDSWENCFFCNWSVESASSVADCKSEAHLQQQRCLRCGECHHSRWACRVLSDETRGIPRGWINASLIDDLLMICWWFVDDWSWFFSSLQWTRIFGKE